MSLSADQRRQLIQWIKAIPQAQFEELLFALGPPAGTISPAPAPHSTRRCGWGDCMRIETIHAEMNFGSLWGLGQ